MKGTRAIGTRDFFFNLSEARWRSSWRESGMTNLHEILVGWTRFLLDWTSRSKFTKNPMASKPIVCDMAKSWWRVFLGVIESSQSACIHVSQEPLSGCWMVRRSVLYKGSQDLALASMKLSKLVAAKDNTKNENTRTT